MIETALERAETSVEEIKKKYYGVTVGRVINMLDPMTLGRVQVQLPFIDSLDLSPWARIAVPMAGQLSGFYFIPNIGDEVLVAFEQGDVNVPYIIGSLWNAAAPPPMPSPVPQIRAIRTLTGNQIVFTEAPPSITVQTAPTPPTVLPTPPSPTGPHQTVSLNPAGVQVMTPIGVQIVVGTNTVTVTPAGIVISGASVNIAAVGTLSLAGATVNITGGAINITGGLVKIN